MVISIEIRENEVGSGSRVAKRAKNYMGQFMVMATHILKTAAETVEQRGAERDSTDTGERSMRRTVEAFNALTGHQLTEVEGWLFMTVLKAARATAGGHKLDDYLDGAAYFALAGECADAEDKADREFRS